MYKIRNTRTGLYSTGGSSPRWTRTGKAWTLIGSVKNHLHAVQTWRRRDYYANAEIVIFNLTETATIPLEEAVSELGLYDS